MFEYTATPPAPPDANGDVIAVCPYAPPGCPGFPSFPFSPGFPQLPPAAVTTKPDFRSQLEQNAPVP